MKILILSLFLACTVFALEKPGKLVTCSSGLSDCSSCPYMDHFVWVYDSISQKCFIKDCNASNVTNYNDQYCLSCESENLNTYSNGYSCVQSQDSCTQRTQPWTNSECQICDKGQFAIFNGEQCSNNECNQQTWTDQECQQCNQNYRASANQDYCESIYGISCFQNGSQVSDLYCQTCQSPYNYADLYLQKCVQASDTCGKYYNSNAIFEYLIDIYNPFQVNAGQRNTEWTDDDCKKCGSQYALPFQTGCFSCEQIQQQSKYTDQLCQICYGPGYFANINQSNCVQSSESCGNKEPYPSQNNQRPIQWTNNDCKLCYSESYAFVQKYSSCFSCEPIQGQYYNDEICQSCFGNNYFATSNSTNCGQPSDTCNYSLRTKIWTDEDCQLCNLGQHAFQQYKQGCFDCQQGQYYNDEMCQSCFSEGYFSSNDGNCVKSSYSCSRNRTQDWTDNDCQLCKLGQYAFKEHLAGCFYCQAGQYQNDEMCQSCFGKNYFVASDGNCVQSNDSCKNRKNDWTDEDCKLCQLGQYAYKKYLKGCFSCQTTTQSQYWTDEMCQICQGNNYFSATDRKSCVQSSDSCSQDYQYGRSKPWTDSDCQLCNAGQYASLTKNGCISCQDYKNDEVCQKCVGKDYFASYNGQACVKSSDTCENNLKQRIAPWTDQDCQLCGVGTYALANQSGCFYCDNDSTKEWFHKQDSYDDEICLKCYGEGYFATQDRQSCVQSSDSCQTISLANFPFNTIISFSNVRKTLWTDQDCQLCKAGKQAFPDKLGCYACPNQSSGVFLNDKICSLCYGEGYFATIDGQTCIQSSDTCGRYSMSNQNSYYENKSFRKTPWTDEDCRICQAGQYASFDKTSCFSCIQFNPKSDKQVGPNYQLNDYMCQTCFGSGFYANSQGVCVKSSDTCGFYLSVNNTRNFDYVNTIFDNQYIIFPKADRKTPWTNEDCVLCQAGYQANFDKSYCSPIQCNYQNKQDWTDDQCQMCGLQYHTKNSTQVVSLFATIDRTNCVYQYQSCNILANLTDKLCQNCHKNPKMFATLDGLKCIQSQDSCNSKVRKALWTNIDCQLCKKGQYATFDKKGCSKTADCSSKNTPFTDDFCQQCSVGNQFASADGLSCVSIKHSCNHSSKWTQKECQLCYNSKRFVNIQGTSCVESKDKCQNREGQWTEQDCKLCYNQNNIYPNILQTECINVNCKKTSGWTDFECFRCNPQKPIASSNKSSCQQK